jgi:hypothetical protein
MMALICGEDMECFSSLEAGILAQHLRMSTPKKVFSEFNYSEAFGKLCIEDLKKARDPIPGPTR